MLDREFGAQCAAIEPLLAAMSVAPLDASDKRLVEAHLGDCQRCLAVATSLLAEPVEKPEEEASMSWGAPVDIARPQRGRNRIILIGAAALTAAATAFALLGRDSASERTATSRAAPAPVTTERNEREAELPTLPTVPPGVALEPLQPGLDVIIIDTGDRFQVWLRARRGPGDTTHISLVHRFNLSKAPFAIERLWPALENHSEKSKLAHLHLPAAMPFEDAVALELQLHAAGFATDFVAVGDGGLGTVPQHTISKDELERKPYLAVELDNTSAKLAFYGAPDMRPFYSNLGGLSEPGDPQRFLAELEQDAVEIVRGRTSAPGELLVLIRPQPGASWGTAITALAMLGRSREGVRWKVGLSGLSPEISVPTADGAMLEPIHAETALQIRSTGIYQNMRRLVSLEDFALPGNEGEIIEPLVDALAGERGRGRRMTIRADAATPWQLFQSVLVSVRQSGISSVQVVVRNNGKDQALGLPSPDDYDPPGTLVLVKVEAGDTVKSLPKTSFDERTVIRLMAHDSLPLQTLVDVAIALRGPDGASHLAF